MELFGLKGYLYNAPRTNIISANKEGIFGIAGFLCIYIFGLSVGQDLNNKLEFL